MPMKFSVGVGPYLAGVNAFYRDSNNLKNYLPDNALRSQPLENVQQLYTLLAGISQGDKDHFADDWISAGGGQYSKTFPYVKSQEIRDVLVAGNLQAIQVAYDNGWDEVQADGTTVRVPLPIQQAWVVNGSHSRFEFVTILNEGLNVQVLICTPEPKARETVGQDDVVWITSMDSHGQNATTTRVQTPASPRTAGAPDAAAAAAPAAEIAPWEEWRLRPPVAGRRR